MTSCERSANFAEEGSLVMVRWIRGLNLSSRVALGVRNDDHFKGPAAARSLRLRKQLSLRNSYRPWRAEEERCSASYACDGAAVGCAPVRQSTWRRGLNSENLGVFGNSRSRPSESPLQLCREQKPPYLSALCPCTGRVPESIRGKRISAGSQKNANKFWRSA